ncbi:Pepco domain-containing protein [Lusitaniella coriacea]|uniref:Pepco domain-containing protein n=1 Tax=Lusitaniella coriacea TaxID=1983105 RepID=UPI003CEE0057
MPKETIRIVTNETPKNSSGRKDPIGLAGAGYWDEETEPVEISTTQDGLTFHEISAEKLEQELARLMKAMDISLTRAAAQANMQSVELAEVDISLAISANGSLSIVGLGAEISGTTSISLKLKPKIPF